MKLELFFASSDLTFNYSVLDGHHDWEDFQLHSRPGKNVCNNCKNFQLHRDCKEFDLRFDTIYSHDHCINMLLTYYWNFMSKVYRAWRGLWISCQTSNQTQSSGLPPILYQVFFLHHLATLIVATQAATQTSSRELLRSTTLIQGQIWWKPKPQLWIENSIIIK